jgi:Holliday junction resolvase RusA-like endonuclease
MKKFTIENLRADGACEPGMALLLNAKAKSDVEADHFYDGKIRIFLPIVPPNSTAQSKGKNYKTGTWYETKAHKADMSDVLLFLTQAEEKPVAPISEPVKLTVIATWPWLGKHKAKTRSISRIYKRTKPDLSNWVKGLEDKLVRAGYLVDDQLVADLNVKKFHGDAVGVVIEIEILDDGEK